ncbi:MAG: peptidylprolyl isomerase [Sedimentisphaerales bacterium]|nr:peptidylprolyl isomerase [Sedimentisphaerales bacterium]
MYKKRLLWCWLAYLAIQMGITGCATTETPRKRLVTRDDPTVAIVNGRAIKQSELLKVLLPVKGRKVLDELVLLEVVRQQAAEKGISAAAVEIQAEFDRILRELAPDKTRREQTALFKYMLEKRNLSQAEFDIIVERQYLLGRLVDPNVTITDKMYADEYERQYGRKVIVRQLVTASFRSILEVRQKLDAGADFARLVEQYSQDQRTLARGGVLGPFSRADEHIPEPVRQAAFELNTPGGRTKPFRFYDDGNKEWWCLLQFEKDFPADAATPAEVRNELTRIIRRRVLNQRMSDLQKKLKQQATVTILEHKLKEGG